MVCTVRWGAWLDAINQLKGVSIRVRGLVQGVGFRPTVWRLAKRFGLTGDVRNDSEGVLIRAFGHPAVIVEFEVALASEAPPLARIDLIETASLAGKSATGFPHRGKPGRRRHDRRCPRRRHLRRMRGRHPRPFEPALS